MGMIAVSRIRAGRRLTRRMAPLLMAQLLVCASTLSTATPGMAAELSAKTNAAFDKYVQVAERRIAREVAQPETFLWADTLGPRKADVLARLRVGEVVVERMRLDGSADVPDGLLHHWIGIVFVPGVHVRDAVELMEAYDRHAAIFTPNIVRSKTLERHDDTFKVFLRFYVKKVVAVTLDTENEAQFTNAGADRWYSAIRSMRVAEVVDAGTPTEHVEQPGRGHGFMWRLNTYWRLLERDGGTYIQCESISLSRDMPFGLGWLIKPFVTEVPKESLAFTLTRARSALTSR
jgi:hypothetical protein